MATVEELKAAITTNRRKLRDALEAAADRWETGDDAGWSPRRIAEHCVGRDFGLGGIGAGSMRGEPAERRFARTNEPGSDDVFSFETATQAVATLEGTGASCDAALRGASDADLERPAELEAGSLPQTLEGVLRLAAWHLNDHAEQLAKM